MRLPHESRLSYLPPMDSSLPAAGWVNATHAGVVGISPSQSKFEVFALRSQGLVAPKVQVPSYEFLQKAQHVARNSQSTVMWLPSYELKTKKNDFCSHKLLFVAPTNQMEAGTELEWQTLNGNNGDRWGDCIQGPLLTCQQSTQVPSMTWHFLRFISELQVCLVFHQTQTISSMQVFIKSEGQ